MLADADLRTAAQRALRRAVDALPRPPPGSDAGRPTSLRPTSRRWLGTVSCASPTALPSQSSRAGGRGRLRGNPSVELANLIMLSEGIRNQMPRAHLSARLIPRRGLEVAHV